MISDEPSAGEKLAGEAFFPGECFLMTCPIYASGSLASKHWSHMLIACVWNGSSYLPHVSRLLQLLVVACFGPSQKLYSH
jgi:hypothetical protein